MNDLTQPREVPAVQETPSLVPFTLEDMRKAINDFLDSARELGQEAWEGFKEGFGYWPKETGDTAATREYASQYDQPAEYHLDESIEAAERVFTPEVIQHWGEMSMEARNACIQEYAAGVGQALGIDFQGIIFENLIDTMGALGYNNGDGTIHLDITYLSNPAMLMSLIDTVAHEEFHQFQFEAIENPEKFGVDDATVREWECGRDVYTTDNPTAYDPWGYMYNPLETGARHYGESVVRELTKDLVNMNA